MMRKIAEGFNKMSKKFIHHYDVKPENFLFANNHLKITDFGISKRVKETLATVTKVRGTRMYEPPEM